MGGKGKDGASTTGSDDTQTGTEDGTAYQYERGPYTKEDTRR